mmetsp:Transcript_849/g.1989  ORF Transcript_849/g.1989 Transcript_849/m.1989 type:complete len:96 (+) Transcript_849:5347-5634(+)
MAHSTEDDIRILPKLEFHAHLNGCVRLSTLKELAVARSIETPVPDVIDLEGAFTLFPILHSVLDNPEAIYRVATEVIEDFAAQNTIYIELRTVRP